MCCLTCAYFNPTEPPEHKVEREANRCASRCGNEWNWHTAFRYVAEHDALLHGVCIHDPKKREMASWDVCGQHIPVLSGENGWGLREFKSSERDRSLVEWARDQYWMIKAGGPNRNTRVAELEAQNQSLRNQLATARKRSASRLARLQKAAKPAKPTKPTKTDEPLQPQLRLVANASN